VQVSVINEARWGKRWLPGDRQTERAQARTASAILTNRGDKASEKQRQTVANELAELNPHAPILTMPALLDLLLKGTIEQSLPAPELSEPIPHRHLHASLQIDLPMMSEERLRQWLVSLPREILRIKGLAQISEKEMAYFHRTDDAMESPRIVKTAYQDSIAPAAVLIGPGIQESTIRESLRAPSSAPNFTFSL
jgi:G3E family GTPase